MNLNNFSNEPDFDKLEELKNEIEISENSEPEIPKKKRGRKPKTETIEVPEIPDIDISPLLNIIVKRLPNPEPLTDIEKSLFNSSANKVFKKYSGDFKYIEEINLTLVLVSVIYPRLKKQNNDSNETA